jgi:RecA-family ATPase
MIKRDINDTLRNEGPDAVRARHDRAQEWSAGNGPDLQSDQQQAPLPWIDISNWDKEPVPQQEWTVLNRIPARQCVLFSGTGEIGKSTVGLHLAAAHVLARDWLHSSPEPGPAWVIDAEDEGKVLHYRLAAIIQHYNRELGAIAADDEDERRVTFASLASKGLRIMSWAGQDAVLATVNRIGKIEPTPLYRQVLEEAGDAKHKPKTIVIASSANVFAGSEIDRSQVQQFVGLLTRLAMTANGSVVLISHPSLEGMKTDTGISGSTQWHNAVRARFYMKPFKSDNDQPADTELREIVFKKNQYGPISDSILLRYQSGLFLPIKSVSSLNKQASENRAEEVFLLLLSRFKRANRNVGDKPGTSYAPAIFAKEEEARTEGLSNRHLADAMRRLFKDEVITLEQYGKHEHHRITFAKEK